MNWKANASAEEITTGWKPSGNQVETKWKEGRREREREKLLAPSQDQYVLQKCHSLGPRH